MFITPSLGHSPYLSMVDITAFCKGVVKLMQTNANKAAIPDEISWMLLKNTAELIFPTVTLFIKLR